MVLCMQGALAGGSEPPTSLPDLRQAFSEARRDFEGVRIEYLARVYWPPYTEDPLGGQFAPPSDARSERYQAYRQRSSVTRWGRSFRIEEFVEESWRGAFPATGERRTFTSDGANWFTLLESTATGAALLGIDPGPVEQRPEMELDAYGWRPFGGVLSGGLPELFLDQGTPFHVQWNESDPDHLLLRMGQGDPLQTEYMVALRRGSGRMWRYDEAWHVRWRPPAPGSGLPWTVFMDWHIRFSESEHTWQGKPAYSIRATWRQHGDRVNFPDSWAVVDIDVVGIQAVPCRREEIQITPRVGSVVQDRCFQMAYPVGEMDANLGGYVESLPRPSEGWLGPNFDAWVPGFAQARATTAAPGMVAAEDVAHVHRVAAGAVSVDGGPALVKGEFTIRNETGTPWAVRSVVCSCGCLKCDVSRDPVPPGQAIGAVMTVQLLHPGERELVAVLETTTGEVHRLVLVAEATSTGTARMVVPWPHWTPDEPGFDVYLVWETPSMEGAVGEAPAGLQPPRVSATGVPSTWTFEGWWTVIASDPGSKRPAKLVGKGRLTLEGDAIPDDLEISAAVPGGLTVSRLIHRACD